MQHCKDSNEIHFSPQGLSDHLIIILQSGTSCSLSISETTIHLSHFPSLSEAIRNSVSVSDYISDGQLLVHKVLHEFLYFYYLHNAIIEYNNFAFKMW